MPIINLKISKKNCLRQTVASDHAGGDQRSQSRAPNDRRVRARGKCLEPFAEQQRGRLRQVAPRRERDLGQDK